MAKRSSPKKSVKLSPTHVVSQKDGSPIDLVVVEDKFRATKDVVQTMVDWGRKSNHQPPSYFKAVVDGADPVTGEELPQNNSEVGRVLGYRYQGFLPDEMLVKSRVERLINHNHVSDDKAWGSKWKAYHGEVKVSKGYANSLNMTPPSAAPVLNFGSVNNHYSNMERDGETLIFHTVVYDIKVSLYFKLPKRCQKALSVSLPTLTFKEDGSIVYVFALEYPRYYPPISSKFVLGVDEGKRYPYMLALVDVSTGLPALFIQPSRRVISLANSVKSNETQIQNIYKIIDKLTVDKEIYDYERVKNYYTEIKNKRQANIRKKKQLAILCGQEIVDVAKKFGNPVIAVEDLSWIVNNMQSGRWNHAELTKWIKHYANHAGLLCYDVWSANSSQNCHKCDNKVTHDTAKRTVYCSCGMFADRDENAAANIGKRVIESALKSAQTRKETRQKRKITHNHTGNTPKHRHTNTTSRNKKGVVTPKQCKVKRKKKTVVRAGNKSDLVVFRDLYWGTHPMKGTMGTNGVSRLWTVMSCPLSMLRNVIQQR